MNIVQVTGIFAVAVVLVLTATGLWAAPAEEESAAAAEKEYVTDPSTGKQVAKPEYGGTLTTVMNNLSLTHGDSWVSHGAGLISGLVTDKLGQADWATDRSALAFTTYFPANVVTGHLAESWENPDPLTYIYKLRDNVFFHDKAPVNGRQLTADDMAANYERLFGIGRFAGQEPAPHTWGTKAIPVESVTATDDLTFVIKLSQPFADTGRQLFDDCHVRAFAPETFDTLDDPNKLIGTGPFTMVEADPGSSITYDRNPNYWKDDEKYPGNRLPYYDRIVVLTMGDEATRLAALRSGQADFIGESGVARITSVASVVDLQKSNPGMQAWSIAFRNETSLSMKLTEEGPLQDIRVRHALQMAIDNETVRDNYFSGFGEWNPMGPIGPAWAGYHNAFDTWPEEISQYWVYDPEGAERLLDEAGYPRGADGVRFRTSMWINAQRANVGYHELQVGYWKEIGVEVELTALDGATLAGKLNSGDWDGMVANWWSGADYGNLDSSLGSFRTGASFANGAYNFPEFDTRYAEYQAMTDPDAARRLAKELDMFVIEQHPYIWGVRVGSFNVAQPWVVGLNGEMQIGNCGWEGPLVRSWFDSQLQAELN